MSMSTASATPGSPWRVLALSVCLGVTGLMLIDLPADPSARAADVHAIFADTAGHQPAPQAIPQH